MQAKQLSEEGGQKTFVLVFDTGEEAVSELTEFARGRGLDAAGFTAVGAFVATTLGYFELDEKEYQKIPVHEQVEVLSLVGNVARKGDGEPQIHAHAVLGWSDGTTRGGQLLEGRVRPTLEVVLAETPAHLRREIDEETGPPLIDIRNT